VMALRKRGQCWSPHGHLIDDIKVLFQRVIPLEINHISRVANMAAHLMAKMAVNQGLDIIWMGECPPCMQSLILAEQVSNI
jgi:hypothetical protein